MNTCDTSRYPLARSPNERRCRDAEVAVVDVDLLSPYKPRPSPLATRGIVIFLFLARSMTFTLLGNEEKMLLGKSTESGQCRRCQG